MFLLSNLLVLTYGSYLTFTVLYNEYLDQYYPDGTASAPKYYWASYRNWILLIHSRSWTSVVTSICMIASLTSPLVIAFIAQHILYIHQGMTTNESEKWSEVQWVANNGMLDIYENREEDAEEGYNGSGSGSETDAGTVHPRLQALKNARPQMENRGRKVCIYAYDDGTFNRLPPPGMIKTRTVSGLEEVVNIYDRGGLFKNVREIWFPKIV